MTWPQVFALAWAVLAVGIGYVFARYLSELSALGRERYAALLDRLAQCR